MNVPVTWITTMSSTATARTPSKAGTNPMVRTARSRPVVSPANGASSATSTTGTSGRSDERAASTGSAADTGGGTGGDAGAGAGA